MDRWIDIPDPAQLAKLLQVLRRRECWPERVDLLIVCIHIKIYIDINIEIEKEKEKDRYR